MFYKLWEDEGPEVESIIDPIAMALRTVRLQRRSGEASGAYEAGAKVHTRESGLASGAIHFSTQPATQEGRQTGTEDALTTLAEFKSVTKPSQALKAEAQIRFHCRWRRWNMTWFV